MQLITVAPGPAITRSGETALWEPDPSHPGGQADVYEGGPPREVAMTARVLQAIADQRLVRLEGKALADAQAQWEAREQERQAERQARRATVPQSAPAVVIEQRGATTAADERVSELERQVADLSAKLATVLELQAADSADPKKAK